MFYVRFLKFSCDSTYLYVFVTERRRPDSVRRQIVWLESRRRKRRDRETELRERLQRGRGEDKKRCRKSWRRRDAGLWKKRPLEKV